MLCGTREASIIRRILKSNNRNFAGMCCFRRSLIFSTAGSSRHFAQSTLSFSSFTHLTFEPGEHNPTLWAKPQPSTLMNTLLTLDLWISDTCPTKSPSSEHKSVIFLSSRYIQQFLSKLLQITTGSNHPDATLLAASCYCGSYLARAGFCRPSLTTTALRLIATWVSVCTCLCLHPVPLNYQQI